MQARIALDKAKEDGTRWQRDTASGGLTYVAMTHRARILDFFPKQLSMVEVGVFEGDYSHHLLSRTDPSLLRLIDPWIQHADPNYERDTANAIDAIQNSRFEKVKDRFSCEIHSGKVQIIRDISRNGLASIQEKSVDFVYIDAMHYERAVYNDLVSAKRVILEDGIIAGHDYANHPLSRRKNFGVIPAVARFCEETGFRPFLITNERWPSYFLARCGSPQAERIMRSIFLSDVSLFGFPALSSANIRQRCIHIDGTEKVVTEVC